LARELLLNIGIPKDADLATIIDFEELRELLIAAFTISDDTNIDRNYESLEFLGDSRMNFFVIIERIMTKNKVANYKNLDYTRI
jgi:dsRNA-specific ribonuclease